MAIDKDERLLPSILDRLLDPDSAGTTDRSGYSERQMMQAVQRDLDYLLNTRQTVSVEPGELERARRVMAFGLPDLSALGYSTTKERERIGHLLEQTISQFEPRLKDVRVLVDGKTDNDPMKVHFHVTARLIVDPAPEMAFDTTLSLQRSTGYFDSRRSS